MTLVLFKYPAFMTLSWYCVLFSYVFTKRKLSRNIFVTYPYFIYLIILRVARTASTIGFHGVDFLVDCGARAHALTYSAYERAHMDSLSLWARSRTQWEMKYVRGAYLLKGGSFILGALLVPQKPIHANGLNQKHDKGLMACNLPWWIIDALQVFTRFLRTLMRFLWYTYTIL